LQAGAYPKSKGRTQVKLFEDCSSYFSSFHFKVPCDIEIKINITVHPIAASLCNEKFLNHSSVVAKVKLKNVAFGIDLYPYR
jgi:hypothetical protein